MKKIAALSNALYLFIFILINIASINANGQNRNLKFELRLPLQYERQRAIIPYTWGKDTQNAKAINFGLDALVTYSFSRFSVYAGAGFFRNRFNIKRFVDHQALNRGRDSLLIGTSTRRYTYSLLRLPLGIHVEIFEIENIQISAGLEHFYNFSFRRKYHDIKPFRGANNVHNGFSYFGSYYNLILSLSRPLQNKNTIQFEPYVRVLNRYRKDRFLKEKENEYVTRHFDAFGIGIKYIFSHLNK